MWGSLMRLARHANSAIRELRTATKRPDTPVDSGVQPELVDFTCNVCGKTNTGVDLNRVSNRECPSCNHCGSSLRMRSVVHALSLEILGKAMVLPDFPNDIGIAGLGMSDWDGYALRLANKLSYTNTYYHTDPRLDITAVPESMYGKYRFLISSDVFEHIPVFSLDKAFLNSRRLLGPEGIFLFTVPFTKEGSTAEHFPNMHDFKIIETAGKRFLYNKTKDGNEEIFDQLVFHGGDGMTLEMRMFSEPDLVRSLKNAGFKSVKKYADQVPEYGIIWPMDWAVPIVARADR
jgi:hypothetical protein